MKAIVQQYKAGFEGVEYKVLPERNPSAGEVESKIKISRIKSSRFIYNE